MSASPRSETTFRIAVDPASSRLQQIEFLLRVIEAKSDDSAPRFVRVRRRPTARRRCRSSSR
jgi:hypothetical protein